MDEDALLASCYWNALDLAEQHGVRSIAFPAISCGVYGFPIERAARIAVETLTRELPHHPQIEQVLLVAFDVRVEAALRIALNQVNAASR